MKFWNFLPESMVFCVLPTRKIPVKPFYVERSIEETMHYFTNHFKSWAKSHQPRGPIQQMASDQNKYEKFLGIQVTSESFSQ